MFHSKAIHCGITLLLAAILLGDTASASAQSSSSVNVDTVQLSALGKSFKVNVVSIDLTDPSLELAPALSLGGIGHDEPFSAIVEREHAAAAINGTFFNSYESNPYNRYPNGLLLESGELMHSGDNQTLFVSKDKVPQIELISTSMAMHVQSGTNTYTVKPWGVNKYFDDPNSDQVVLYTPDFGAWIGFTNGVKAVISEGRITHMTEEAVQVPADGYVLFVGNSLNNQTYLLPNLHVGDTVTSELLASGEGGQTLDARSWLAAIGVGPKLVTSGVTDLDYGRDGFTDPKITQASAMRSFVGIDEADRIVMGTVAGATMPELAVIALQLRLKEAMNMDGGSSSALYANGTMLTTPGRELSNVWVVRKLDKPSVQIELNGQFIPDFKGYIVNDTTVVPIRPFINALKAEFQWDAATRTATIKSGSSVMKLMDGSMSALVNGESVPLPVPLQIGDDSRMYVPLRFVAETLHATVSWNDRVYRASVMMP